MVHTNRAWSLGEQGAFLVHCVWYCCCVPCYLHPGDQHQGVLAQADWLGMGLSIACTVFFWITAEAWKWAKRIYIRRKAANNGDGKENVLNENDPFLKYASFSRDNTMVV